MKVDCAVYGKQIHLTPSRYNKSLTKVFTCSIDCSVALKLNKPERFNVTCYACGKKFHVKPFHLSKMKNPDRVCCSLECSKKERAERMSGDGNHQFGLKGKDNATWKSDVRITVYGYRAIRSLDHPFVNSDGFVFEHRLVAEKFLLTEENSVTIGGKRYLSPDFDVHHIDENKINNSPENLLIITKSEHMSLHQKLRKEKKRKKNDKK